MPQMPSLSRTHHSALHCSDPVIEDEAWSRDISRSERMQQNLALRPYDLASLSGDVTEKVE